MPTKGIQPESLVDYFETFYGNLQNIKEIHIRAYKNEKTKNENTGKPPKSKGDALLQFY